MVSNPCSCAVSFGLGETACLLGPGLLAADETSCCALALGQELSVLFDILVQTSCLSTSGLIIMIDCINERPDNQLQEMIVDSNKRSNKKLPLPRPRTGMGGGKTKFRGTILWNSLSNEDRDIKSKNCMQRKTKEIERWNK